MDLIDIRFYLQEKLRFHIWYLYIWYGLVCFSGIILLTKGFGLNMVLGGVLVDMSIPTIIYLFFRYRKHETKPAHN